MSTDSIEFVKGVFQLNIEQMSLGELGTNCYIVHRNKKALIFDPGGDFDIIERFLIEQELKPLAIFLTHAHFDHIGAVDDLRKKYRLDVYLHEEEADWLENPSLNRSNAFTRKEIRTGRPDKILSPGKIHMEPFQFEVIHTPGHSPGSVTFIFHQERFIISGDVLFHRGVGRTDLPGGSTKELIESIRGKLYLIRDDFVVFPGHGIQTTIGEEKRYNPYVPDLP